MHIPATFRAQYRVGQSTRLHAGTADQTSNMTKIIRVREDVEFLKPRQEEILARATALFNTRFPSDNIEETCDDAQCALDVLQHRTQKFSDAFREFQAMADTIAEDDGLFQRTQGAMLNLLLDAEEMAETGRKN